MRKTVLLLASMALAVLIAGGVAVSLGTESAEAAFPGPNGPIAFAQGRVIKLVNANGSVGTTLRIGAGVAEPDISPDGRRVAYTRSDATDAEIYTINIATHKIRKITSNTVTDNDPTWSPDGSRIAFMRLVPRCQPCAADLFIKRADGRGNPINLTKTADKRENSPEWSPNGKEIAFEEHTTSDIFVLNLTTGQRRNLTKDGGASNDFAPDWAPYGSRVAFVGYNVSTDTVGIYTVSASDGSNRRQLASGSFPHFLQSPKYSPDGTRMAFVRIEDSGGVGEVDSSALYTMNASDGSAKKNIFPMGSAFPDVDWGERARRR